MINIVAILEVNDSDAFEEFETQAIALLRKHNGVLNTAFEVKPSDSSSGAVEEVHCIEFPTTEDFDNYRADPALQALSELRAKAISHTKVYVSGKHKNYYRH